VKADGTIDVAFTGNPSDIGDLTVAIADGVMLNPANLAGIGSGYDGVTPEADPTVIITGADKGSLAGDATVKADGTIDVAFTGTPTGTGNLTVSVANGLPGVSDLSGLGSGYTLGDPAPAVTITGTDKGTLAGTTSINPDGTVDLNFTGFASGTGNLNVQVAAGSPHVSNLTGVGSGFDLVEPAPTVSITGASKGTLAGVATVRTDGKLDIALTGSPTSLAPLSIDADGIFRIPATVSNVGANHDPSAPAPAVSIIGADKGTLAGVASVNPDKTVDVSFAGVPTGSGTLNVQVAGASSAIPISQINLLDLNGDLWDYSVAEFEAFIELLADGRAQNGAEQNSLGVDWNRISTQIGQLEAAKGRITDADFAAEMTGLSKAKILSESSATLFAKHNRITTEALLTLQRLG
jgi:flagellin-like hook-associated protein FlgL